MSSNFLEYKTVVFILGVLQRQLQTYRDKLSRQQKDKSCSKESYQNTLDLCSELEYTIKQMEKFK